MALQVDESSSTSQGGSEIVLRHPTGVKSEVALKLEFSVMNNVAEYEALIAGVKLVHKLGAKHLIAYVDSQLVVHKFEGSHVVKEANMISYLKQVKDLQQQFSTFELHQVPGEENERAGALSKFSNSVMGVRSRWINLLVSYK